MNIPLIRLWNDIQLLATISRSHEIARRYFVTNGFDGALAMLGLTMGFYVGDAAEPTIVLRVCIGTAIALMMSGFSSAYMSETAERRMELRSLEDAMLADLRSSAHGRASRYIPWMISAVNGLSPFVMAMIIIVPLWLEVLGVQSPFPPLESAIALAFGVIFLLGVFLGRASGSFWLWSGVRALVIAAATALLILLLQT